MKAMIFAAGLGTRLKPLTGKVPKALVEINGRPLLEIIINRLIRYGFNDLIINVHHLSDMVIDFIDNHKFNADITISDETEELLDTGGGLKKASWFFNDNKPFMVHNVDVLTDLDLKALYDSHCSSGSIATLAVKQRDTSRYFLFGDNDILCGWKNISTGEEIITGKSSSHLRSLAFSGIQVLSPDIFNYITEKGKFSMTGVYIRLAKENRIKGFIHNESLWIDIGKKETLPEAGKILKKIQDA